MKQFKIRCSAISKIMSDPRNKVDKEAGKLGETTKTYVGEWLAEQIFGVRKELDVKVIKKGLIREDEAIRLLAEYKREFFVKNEQYFSDDYMTGTPDIITDEKIIDIKCSWDCFTFPLFDSQDELDNAYYWQMQGYMYLTGKREATVTYMLMNTPDELAYTDLDRVDYTTYPTIQRIKEFHVKRNDEDIERIKLRVSQVNQHLKQMIENDPQIKKILG